MELFAVDKEFNNFREVQQAKSDYERQNNVVLVIRDCHKIKGEGDIVKEIVYDRLSLQCKAGKERPTESKGIRKSATYKKNCPMKVSCIKFIFSPHFEDISVSVRIILVQTILLTIGFVSLPRID